MKVCSKCKENKSLDSYYSYRGKLRSQCKLCMNITNRVYRNKEEIRLKVNASSVVYYNNHLKERETYRKDYYEKNHQRIKNLKNNWVEKNPEIVKATNKSYRENNKGKVLLAKKLWRENNKEKQAAAIKAWSKANPAKLSAKSAKRRSIKLQATPKWLTKEHWKEIEDFYALAQELAWLNQDGKPFHVDHIVPLNGKNVCGLHVPWNLQLLSKMDNLQKGIILGI